MAVQQLNKMPADHTSRKKLSKAGKKTAEEILLAAEKLFSQRGFKETTLKDVSELSSANTALISYYFGNKDGLRDAVFERQLRKAGTGFEALFAVDPSAYTVTSFKQLIRVMLDRSEEDDTLFRLITWSTLDKGEIADKMAEVIWDPFLERLIAVVEHLTHGSIPRKEIESRVWAMSGSIYGYVHCRWHSVKHAKTTEKPEVILAQYKDLIVNKVTDSLLEA